MAQYRQPRIDYGPEDTLRDLSSLILQLGFKHADKNLERKEKRKAEGLILLSEQYKKAENALSRKEIAFDTSKKLYGALLGPIQDVDRTEGSDIVTKDLSAWYKYETSQIRDTMRDMDIQMNTMYSDIADIDRLRKGLATVTPTAGDPLKYDPKDFETKRLSKLFNVPGESIEKWRKRQPEHIPTQIRALEKLRLEAGEVKKGKSQQDLKTEQTTQIKRIGERLANAPFVQDMASITGSEDLNEKGKLESILSIGTDYGGVSLSRLLDPENEPRRNKEGKITDSKKVVKAKRDKQLKKVQNLYHTFSSFSKTGPKDVMGLGRFVSDLTNKLNSLTPQQQPSFKAYINNTFNIDLDASDQFILPGYTLEKGGKSKQTKGQTVATMTAEELVLYDFKNNSNLPRAEYLANNAQKIKQVFESKYPDLSQDQFDKKIRELWKYLDKT